MSEYVSIITGASRGIGKAIAIKFAREGHKLALFARNEERLQECAEYIQSEYGAEVLWFAGDAGDTEFVNKSVKAVQERFGRIDNLINNAGIAIFRKFVDSNVDEFKKQIDANIIGVYNFTRAVIDYMIDQKT